MHVNSRYRKRATNNLPCCWTGRGLWLGWTHPLWLSTLRVGCRLCSSKFSTSSALSERSDDEGALKERFEGTPKDCWARFLAWSCPCEFWTCDHGGLCCDTPRVRFTIGVLWICKCQADPGKRLQKNTPYLPPCSQRQHRDSPYYCQTAYLICFFPDDRQGTAFLENDLYLRRDWDCFLAYEHLGRKVPCVWFDHAEPDGILHVNMRESASNLEHKPWVFGILYPVPSMPPAVRGFFGAPTRGRVPTLLHGQSHWEIVQEKEDQPDILELNKPISPFAEFRFEHLPLPP